MKRVISGLMMAALPLAVSLAWAADPAKDHKALPGDQYLAGGGCRAAQLVM